MPLKRHIRAYHLWRVFPPDGAGGPDLRINTLDNGRQYGHRAQPHARFETETRQRYADNGVAFHAMPDYVTPGNFVRSSAPGFEDAIYLALTQPLRELGA
jgi:hypothetical protein